MLKETFISFITQLDGNVFGNCLPIVATNDIHEEEAGVYPYTHYAPTPYPIDVGEEAIKRAISSAPFPLPLGCYIIWENKLEAFVNQAIGRKLHISPELILLSMTTKAVWMRIQAERKKAWKKDWDPLDVFFTDVDFAQNLPEDFPIEPRNIGAMYQREIKEWMSDLGHSQLLKKSAAPEVLLLMHAECYFASALAMHCGTMERITRFYKDCRKTGIDKNR